MLSKFKEYIKENNLFSVSDTILIAVSGGIDSMVLTHLFRKSNFNFSIAHCNFSLRGEESDKDEKFVRELASNLNVKFHCKKFDTQLYCEEKGISTQMGARELRYAWFNELLTSENYQFIAVGTHLNDAIETFILNATKGTGIAGLRGISVKNKSIIRPLLFADSAMIITYSKQNNINYRTDKSNASTYYLRNKIRHKIIPVLEEINPNLTASFSSNFSILKDTESIYKRGLEAIFSIISKQKNQQFGNSVIQQLIIDLEKLEIYPEKKTILYELVAPYGFNSNQTNAILNASLSGKTVYSATHQLLKNRGELVLSQQQKTPKTTLTIPFVPFETRSPLTLSANFIEKDKINFNKGNYTAYLDASKVKFPLTIRNWQQGDFFQPLGMKGKKKLSDFFIDIKFSLSEKKNVFVLCDKQNIIWVIGYRMDDRYKITATTEKVIEFTLKATLI